MFEGFQDGSGGFNAGSMMEGFQDGSGGFNAGSMMESFQDGSGGFNAGSMMESFQDGSGGFTMTEGFADGSQNPVPAVIASAQQKKAALTGKEGFSNMGNLFSPQFENAKHKGASAEAWANKPYQGPTGEMVYPDSDLFFFAKTNSSPECCLYSSYSDSGGCKCLSAQQWQYISDRGGNNMPPSEY